MPSKRKKGPSLSVGRGEKLSVKRGGGLTAKGRAKYNRATGSNLKAPAPNPKTKKDVQKHRDKWWEFKSTLKCEKCGFSHPAAIDFHHPEGKGDTKVSHYVSHKQWKRAYEEAEKCQKLCANCHRILHYEEKMKKD